MEFLPYSFAITPVFNFIANKSTEAGLFVYRNNTKQTVQLFMKDKITGEIKRIGAIQYEGSNDYTKKEPYIINWRFERGLLPNELRQDLETITSFRRDKNKGPSINPNAQSIAFKFRQLTDAEKETIEEIVAVLKKHLLP